MQVLIDSVNEVWTVSLTEEVLLALGSHEMIVGVVVNTLLQGMGGLDSLIWQFYILGNALQSFLLCLWYTNVNSCTEKTIFLIQTIILLSQNILKLSQS